MNLTLGVTHYGTPNPKRDASLLRCTLRSSRCDGRYRSDVGLGRRGGIVVALVVCATIVLVAVAITRHANNKQDAAWCYDHGYANYTQDGFCGGCELFANAAASRALQSVAVAPYCRFATPVPPHA